jgi:hypothetical protein
MHMMATVARLPSIASRLGICHGTCKQEDFKMTQTVCCTYQRARRQAVHSLTCARKAHRLLTARWRGKAARWRGKAIG